MPNVIIMLLSVHCIYTCMLVHFYLGGLSKDDHHSEPRQNFFFSGKRVEVWSTLLAYALYPGSSRYLISSKREVKSQFTELKYLAPILGH